jgi:hypothetical protein
MPKIKVVQLTNYESAKHASEYIRKQKLECPLLKSKKILNDKKTNRKVTRYAVFIRVKDGKELFGKAPEMVDAKEMISPKFLFSNGRIIKLQTA